RGGCLTGPNHAGAELHGFLAYLARCFHEDRAYRIYGYKGKQVRDNIHSHDVCTAFAAFYESPRIAAVYNLGGGRQNSISILEAISRMEDLTGKRLRTEYVESNRVGDHICYISDLRRLQQDYPQWKIEISLEEILRQFALPRTKSFTTA
ncbi:MAG: NAD-dependent epimerase/dehydratase family protein, partial [Acidobacteriaceae bacterium]|nr:NAD-dependent epimerase/dehydratase family protein [Acidobacteriaceae bacterium]